MRSGTAHSKLEDTQEAVFPPHLPEPVLIMQSFMERVGSVLFLSQLVALNPGTTQFAELELSRRTREALFPPYFPEPMSDHVHDRMVMQSK
jgi:hypothetical protein